MEYQLPNFDNYDIDEVIEMKKDFRYLKKDK